MEEKERRVDLYRRLMEKEQSLAELKMYVKMLEEKVQRPAMVPPPVVRTPAAAPPPIPRPAPSVITAPRVATPRPANDSRETPLPPPIPFQRAPSKATAASPDSKPRAEERKVAAGSKRPLPTDGWKTW
jgi:hypothetical protein